MSKVSHERHESKEKCKMFCHHIVLNINGLHIAKRYSEGLKNTN